MFQFRTVFALLVLALQILSACSDPSPSPGRPAPLSQDITLRGGVDGERKVDGADLKPGDCAALMAYVNAQDDSWYHTYRRLEILGEMRDRGICVSHDMARAFEAFRNAGEAWGQKSHPVTAWKLWYGHGIEQNRMEALRQFRRWLPVWAGSSEPDRKEPIRPRVFRDRPMPPPFLKDLDWLADLVSDRERYMRWAARLYLGKAKYRDGTIAPASPDQAERIYHLNQANEDRFLYAETLFDEASTNDDRREAEWPLRSAANCGYLPAVVKLVDVFEASASERSYELRNAYGWALVAKVLGADLDERLSDFRTRLSVSDADAGHGAAERHLADLKDCE